MNIVEFLRARYDAEEQAAREASHDHRGGPYTDGGEHWHWVCESTDQPVTIDPVTDEYVWGDDHSPVALRSVEEYPTRTVGLGLLPHFVIASQGELFATDALHIAYWGPARVLADIAAKRKILDEAAGYSPELEHGDNGEWAFDTVLRALAQPYAEHPDYRQEWAL